MIVHKSHKSLSINPSYFHIDNNYRHTISQTRPIMAPYRREDKNLSLISNNSVLAPQKIRLGELDQIITFNYAWGLHAKIV